MVDLYLLTEFKSLGAFNESAKLSHTVDRGMLPDSDQVWYRKEMPSPAKARNEWLAQEFLRLIIPNQIETRLAYNPVNNIYYILSAESKGFEPLPKNEMENFTNGTYKGLGNVIMGAYFVHETDLKNGNIGKDINNIVIKIDGDWAFASMRDNAQFPRHSAHITAFQLLQMPFPRAYRSHNWLDIVNEGNQYSESQIVDKSISKAIQYQAEMFETMISILLIPKSYLTTFIDGFIPAGASDYIQYLQDRQEDLLNESKLIPGFKLYIQNNSEYIQNIADQLINRMMNFTVNGKELIQDNQEKNKFKVNAKNRKEEIFNAFNIVDSSENTLDSVTEDVNPESLLSKHSLFTTNPTKDENLHLMELKQTEYAHSEATITR